MLRMQPKVDAQPARIRVGGGWLIAPQVPGLKADLKLYIMLNICIQYNDNDCMMYVNRNYFHIQYILSRLQNMFLMSSLRSIIYPGWSPQPAGGRLE